MRKPQSRFYPIFAILACISLINLSVVPALYAATPPMTGTLHPSLVPQAQTANVISITDSGFAPNLLEVVAGTEITWQNQKSTTEVLRSGSSGSIVYLPLVKKFGTTQVESSSSGNHPAKATDDTFDVTIAPGASFAHTYQTPGTYTYYLAASPGVQGTVVVNPTGSTLKLTPIGSQTALLGGTLTLKLAATGGAGALSFGVTPLPLPPNVVFDAQQATFTFQPAETQIGAYTFTFAVTDGNATAVETVAVTVPAPDPNAETSLRGLVLDANEAQKGHAVPLVGATVRYMGSNLSTTTDGSGYFMMGGLTPGEHYFEYDGSTANPSGTYGAYRGQKNLIPHVVNVIERPIYIMKIDKTGETTVNPNASTPVHNPNIDVTVNIPAGTVVDDAGKPYSGKISVSPVPKGFTPAALPDTMSPGTVVTIQPMGLKFTQPAPVSFPNDDNLPPGSEVNIWSLDHELGKFFIAGKGRVSADGTMIDTIPGQGGIRESSWHFLLALLASILTPPDGSLNNSTCRSGKPTGSNLILADGCLDSSFTLPGYNSLGEARQLEFGYHSEWADPQPILPFEALLPVQAAVPPKMSYKLMNFGGMNGGDEVYWDTSKLAENKDEPLRGAIAVAGDGLSTGIYPYKIRLTSHYASSSVASDINGNQLLVNGQNSPFGAGWDLAGLQRLYPQNDGNILLTDSTGAERFELANLLLNDAFDNENGGTEQFNYYNLLNWGVTKGSIDIIGNGSTNDLLPGHGLYLDLDGSTGMAVHLESRTAFMLTPGEYQLAFDLAGSQRGAVTTLDSVNISMGSLYSETFTLRRDTPFTTITRILYVSQPTSAKLIFDSSLFPSDNIGLLLDNVKLQRIRADSGTFNFPINGLEIPSKANIFGAGHRRPPAPGGGGGGVFPIGVTFPADAGQVLTFANVTGAITCNAQFPTVGPDGGLCGTANATNIQSYDGIAGIVYPGAMALVGVFLSPRVPVDPAPGRLEMKDVNFTELSPALNQVFFIGDGKTVNGVPQQFHVPAGATRFFLGIADALSIDGQPGYYDDNIGAFNASFTLRTPGGVEAFFAPEGDFSVLVHNPDSTYTRRMKDGAEFRFNASGLQTAMVDRNGNTTAYAYDGDGRLSAITDPANLITNFVYSNGRMSQVTDPMGRITTFTHDTNGNLSGVAFPDSTQQSFGYGDKHLLTTETDRRGQTRTHTYDAYGRLVSANLPGNVTRVATYSQKIGLAAQGQGTVDTPAPVIRPADVHSTITDGEGRTTGYTIGSLGTVATVTDPAGLTTGIIRDANANPLKTTLPSGAVFDRGYDSLGNLTSFADSTVQGTTHYGYDATFNQLTSVTDPFNNVTTFAYDIKGNLTQATSPLNRTLRLAYDNHGLPTSLVDSLGTETRFAYNGNGNLTQIVSGMGADERTTSMLYTPHGYMQNLTDPLGRVSSFTYDAFGRTTGETLPGSRAIAYQYDGEGNLTSLTPPGRLAHTFEYDGLGQLTAYVPPAVANTGNTRTTYEYNKAQQLIRVVRPDNLPINYGYDQAGRLTSTQFSRGSVTYAYNPSTGQLSAINAPDSVNLAYQYKGELLAGESWSGPLTGNVQYAYDAKYRITSVSVNGAPINYQYDKDDAPIQAGGLSLAYDATTGLLSATSLGAVTDAWSYNAFAEPEGYTAKAGATLLYQTSYTHDKLGRILTKTEIIGGQTINYAYSYDEAGRLIEVKQGGTTTESYTYDANGNRLTALGGVTATYDDQDRLLTYGNTNYAYNANGELSGKTGGENATYTYDEFGNLTSATVNDKTIEYIIDGQNRLVGRKVNGAFVQGWLYEGGLRPVAEVDASGTVVSRFVYGSHINVPEYMVRAEGTYRLITDHLGSVRLVVNTQNGAIAQQIDYDAFGKVLQAINRNFQPFGFAGGLYDADTGLVRFGARDYDASVGRWTTKDPIGVDGGDVNLYGYVSQNPINAIDFLGWNTVVVLGGPTLGNPLGHVAIGFTGQGIFSFGTKNPLGSSFTDYLKAQAQYRSSIVFLIKTTPKQEARMLERLKQYSGTPLPDPWKHPLDAYYDTCAVRTTSALKAGNMGNIFSWLQFPWGPLPNSTGEIAFIYADKMKIIPKGGTIPEGFESLNP